MKNWSVRRITTLSLIIALTFIGRILLQPIPNVQPVTAILIILTLRMGTMDGIIVALGSMILSNIILGMGPWTISQLITYTLIILLTGWVMRRLYKPNSLTNRIFFGGYAFLIGLLYGFIISVITVFMLDIANFWTYYLYGLSFDIMHGIGNFAFYLLLEPILDKLLTRYIDN